MLLKVYRRKQAKSDKFIPAIFNAKAQRREGAEKMNQPLHPCAFAPLR
jgi:hypothetical protein